MTRFARTARMAAILAATAFSLMTAQAARADETMPDVAVQETLTAKMAAEGYEVRKMQMEDGMIEVYAVKDGMTYEMYYGADLALIKSCTDGVCTDAAGAKLPATDSDND